MTTLDLLIAGIIAVLILVVGFALWLAGRRE
jgi:hypothetical protein